MMRKENTPHTSSAWQVRFYHGFVWYYGKNNQNKHVRAVRGTQSSAQNFIDNYNRTVTDTQNGLMWELKTTDNMNYTYNWQEALSYCENLTLLGYADWRLPNINELQSLVDYERFDPAIKPFFPNTLPFEYWSSTSEVQNGGDGALYVHFSRGKVIDSDTSNVNGKSYLYFVRAVRNVGDYDQDQIGDMEDNCPTCIAGDWCSYTEL
jgi:hypothetical protein